MVIIKAYAVEKSQDFFHGMGFFVSDLGGLVRLLDLLKKVSLGGMLEICTLSKDCSVAVTDETNNVLIYCKPKRAVKGFAGAIGIRNLSRVIHVLSAVDEQASIEMSKECMLVNDSVGKRKLRFADLDAMPKIETPLKVLKDLCDKAVASAMLTNSDISTFVKMSEQMKPEIITIEVVKTGGSKIISCTLGEDIGDTGRVVLIADKVTCSVAQCKSVYRADFLNSIFSAITADEVSFEFGDNSPLIIKEHLHTCETTWCLSPFNFVSE